MATSNRKSSSGGSPNTGLRMSSNALHAMRNTERVMLKYYNDMGRNKGNCTWGVGFYAHKGICTPEELERKVSASSVELEYVKRVTEAERHIKVKVKIKLTQDQFDGLVSFTYNTTNVTNDRVYQALNDNDFNGAARKISEANKVKVNGKWKLAPGLINRRAEESASFRSVSSSVR